MKCPQKLKRNKIEKTRIIWLNNKKSKNLYEYHYFLKIKANSNLFIFFEYEFDLFFGINLLVSCINI